MTETGMPKKRGAMPWLIGCGLAILVVILALGGFAFYLFKTSVFFDREVTAALAAEIAPGATAPDGYVPLWGMHISGMKMVVFGPPGTMDAAAQPPAVTRFVVASTDKGDVSVRAMRESAFGRSEIVDEAVHAAGIETVQAGAVAFRLRKARFEQGGVMHLGFELDLEERDGRHGKIMFVGPEKTFDRAAMAAFLGSLDAGAVRSGTPAPGAPDNDTDKDADKDGDKDAGKDAGKDRAKNK